jgi:hypothetical protein
MIVPMCLRCLKDYEMDPPAMQTNSSTCACCDSQFVTVGWLSGETIDKINEEQHV